jgi:tetratricopeptide (TPR) repeat protein
MKKDSELKITAEEALRRADILFERGDEAEARAYYRMVSTGGRKNAEVFFRYAVEIEDERHDAAIKYYLQALKLDPAHSEACYGAGRMFGRTGDLEKAILYFRKAIKLAPKDAKSYCGLGLALSQKGKHREALKNIKKALSLEPEDSIDYRIYAMILENKGDLEGALKQYRKSETLERNPQVAYEIEKLKVIVEDEGG